MNIVKIEKDTFVVTPLTIEDILSVVGKED